MNLLNLLGTLKTWKITEFAKNSDGSDDWDGDRTEADVSTGANCVSSQLLDESIFWGDNKHHKVLLDLDVPAYLVPSSQPGHSHLYIDVIVEEERYFRLLDSLAECGVIEHGYASASRRKGGTFLRLPWIKKEGVAA